MAITFGFLAIGKFDHASMPCGFRATGITHREVGSGFLAIGNELARGS